jgi:4-amino-4-deoxy-L-arabinose transferase-like glycosyltransferase
VLAPKALNVFLGAATVLAVYLLGARLFDRRAGLLAAALLALFPGQVFFSTLIMTEVFFAALLTTVVLLVIAWTLADERPAAYKLLLLGLLLGYGAITRGEGGMLVLVVMLIWWLTRSAWSHSCDVPPSC